MNKFKANDKVVYADSSIPNNLVMNVKRGTYKSSGVEMVTVELPGGLAHSFSSELRLATEAEAKLGIRHEK